MWVTHVVDGSCACVRASDFVAVWIHNPEVKPIKPIKVYCTIDPLGPVLDQERINEQAVGVMVAD